MAEWLVEQGIGEERAILREGDEILAARLYWPGALTAGQVEEAKLVFRTAGSRRGTARFASGEEALVSGLSRDAGEGATLRLKVTRAAIAEAGRTKLAQARPSDEAPRSAPSLAEALGARIVPRFEGWDELIADAFARKIEFDGGALWLSATPAMTLLDIDGPLAPPQLALAAIPAIAAAVKRLDIGGSVGIDFPTLSDKAHRRAVDRALAEALDDWPHERTAINGFGFVQLVARLEGPSILQRIAADRAGAAARLLLRRAEAVAGPGALLLSCHPAVGAKLGEEWRAELARRTGRTISVETNPALPLEGGHAQTISR
ncbi:MAG: ribonuclease [Novosphingobium sp.]|nr:ribonuclease [Novosphingobium sp.]MBO9600983.1 ribonuclease [Novosphingobium sp.]